MTEKRLHSLCTQFRGRLRGLLVQYGILRAVFFCLLATLVLVVCDWYFRFNPDLRLLALLAVFGVAGSCYFFDFHRPLRRSWSDDEVLRYMDRTMKDGDDVLTTLRDLSEPEGMREWDTDVGKEIINSTVADLGGKVGQVKVRDALSDRPIRLWRRMAAVLVAMYVIGVIVPRDPLSGSYLLIGLKRILLPYAAIFWPQKTRIFVQKPETGWRVPKGEQFLVKAKIEGVVPDIVEIKYKSESSGVWITERMAVSPQTSECSFTFQEMLEPVKFCCVGGDDKEKRMYSVTVAERPILTSVVATYKYPPYTKLQGKILKTGQVSGIEGTDVKLEFTASTDLLKAEIKFELDGEEEAVVEPADLRRNKFSHSFMLTRSGSYTVELTDTESLKNGRVERFDIRVDPDNPPEITLESPIRDQILTAKGKVHVKFKAEDDYNIAELNVMLGPVGGEGQALSAERITGDFWQRGLAQSRVGEGEFELDFLRHKDYFKNWKIDSGAELNLWVRAMDCNPTKKGISESMKVRLSLKHPTDFMDEIVLKAKELIGDAKEGWYNAAGAFHDGRKWFGSPTDDKLMEGAISQQETAERAAAALALRFPPIMDAVNCNRMSTEFMSRRLDAIGSKINDLKMLLPDIGRRAIAGRPASSEEAQPEKRKAKMANALRGISGDQNKAAWQMRLLYSHLSDWVALQSVLLKTRRIEELQRLVNGGTEKLVKKTLGREARELEEDEVREMKELGNQQNTAYEMGETVEKELSGLIVEAERDGRRKVYEWLGRALRDLSDNQVRNKMKRAVMAILDARGDTVRNDQKVVLETVAILNRGLIKAGEEVPADPSAAEQARPIEDPRGKTVEEDEKTGGEAPPVDIRKLTGDIVLKKAKPDTLDDTLQKVKDRQDDIRGRTSHVAERGQMFPRYMFLRTGLTAQRQGEIVDMLKKAVGQVGGYGKAAPAEGEAPREPDPTLSRKQERLTRQIGGYLGNAQDALALLKESDFGELTQGVQKHVQEGAKELREYIQETEQMHDTFLERKASSYEDPFGRKFLLNENNFVCLADVEKDLEWALVQQAAAQREAALLGLARRAKKASGAAKPAVERILNTARSRNEEIVRLIGGARDATTKGLSDPAEPDRENERVKPKLAEILLNPLDLKQFNDVLGEFGQGNYDQAALKQDSLRDVIASALLSLKDLFKDPVPAVKIGGDDQTNTNIIQAVDDVIEYEDETPARVADLLESDGAWIDERVGNAEIRKNLIKRLREIGQWDPRYARLQSYYFQALAHNFQAKAKKDKKDKDKDKGKGK